METNERLSAVRGFRVEKTEPEAGVMVVRCHGKLTSENAPLLKEEMRDVLTKKCRIVIDLKEVPMMDSSGLGVVVSLYVSARTRGCKLELVNASRQIQDLFSMTNLLSLFGPTGRHGGRLI